MCVRLFHVQQRAVAAETSAERRQPPMSTRLFCSQRGLQHEIYEGTAEVAVFTQDRGTVRDVSLRQCQFLGEGGQHVTTAGMPDPSIDVAALQAFGLQHLVQHLRCIGRGQCGNLAGQDVAQQTAALFEAQGIAMGWIDPRCRPHPAHAALAGLRRSR